MTAERQGPMLLTVVRGDITDVAVDALVNAANNRFVMGAGVAGAIKRKGGKIVEDEAVRQGPLPVGSSVVTSAGRLPARYVIHAAVMGMDFTTDAEKIRAATISALDRAGELPVERMAFPALGTGVGQFPFEDCAHIMVEAARAHAPDSLKEILFVVMHEEAVQAFQAAVAAAAQEAA